MTKAFGEFLEGDTIFYFNSVDDAMAFLEYSHTQEVRHHTWDDAIHRWLSSGSKLGLGYNVEFNSLWVVLTEYDERSMRYGRRNIPPLKKVIFDRSMINETGFFW